MDDLYRLKVKPVAWFALLTLTAAGVFTGFAMLVRHRGNVFNAGDPVRYYVYLRSLVHDGDLDFSNDYDQCLQRADGSPGPHTLRINSVTGLPDNDFTIGLPLLVSPLYLAGNLVFSRYYPSKKSRARFPLFLDQMIFSYGSLALGFLGLWLSFKFVCFYFRPREALIATIAFWLCSPLIYYFGREPFMSHLASLFAVSLLLYLWKAPSFSLAHRALLIGVVGAVVTMVRQQDVVTLVIPLSLALSDGTLALPRKTLLTSLLFAFVGFTTIFAIQMLVWYRLRGSFLTFSYSGQSFEYLFEPKIVDVLFSSNHGLLSWHPLVALCVLGWLQLRRTDSQLSSLVLICFGIELYVTASWWCWWMGSSFGNRGFLSLTPLFILGLATFYNQLNQRWMRRFFVLGVTLLFIWNATLMLAYLSEVIPYEGQFSWWTLIEAIPSLPVQILAKVHRIQSSY